MSSDVVNVTEKKVLSLLENSLMSTSQLAKELGMRRDMVVGYLEALRDQGKVEKIRVGRSDVYINKSAKRGTVQIA
jgi:predicted transcriptional regulator